MFGVDKMRIGIDIDDTICCSIENMLPYICEFYNFDYEIEKSKGLGYDSYHCLPNYREFAEKYYERVMRDAKLKDKADYYINKLHELGHEIIFITARSRYGFTAPYELSKEYLEKYNIHYDKLIIAALEKGKVCRDEKIDVFVDDNLRNCYNVENVGVRVLLFDNTFNREDTHFERVINWEDAYNKFLNKKINH